MFNIEKLTTLNFNQTLKFTTLNPFSPLNQLFDFTKIVTVEYTVEYSVEYTELVKVFNPLISFVSPNMNTRLLSICFQIYLKINLVPYEEVFHFV